MLCRMSVEHIVDKGPFESCAGTHENRKSRAGNFCRTVEIQDVESFTNLPVALGWRRQCGRGSPLSYLYIAACIFPLRHGDVRSIWDAEVQIGQSFLDTP